MNMNDYHDNVYISYKILVSCLALPFFILIFFSTYDFIGFKKSYSILTWFVMLVLIAMLWEWRKHQIIVLFILYVMSHAFVFILYYCYGFRISFYNAYQSNYHLGNVLMSFSLFVLSFWIFSKPEKFKKAYDLNNSTLRSGIIKTPNKFLYSLALFMMLFVLLFGFSGQNIFESGGYGKSAIRRFFELNIYEYFLIFYLLAYKYSVNSKRDSMLLFLFAFFYVSKNLIFGGRIESLQMIFMVFILFFENKYSYKIILPFAIIFVLFFSFWGQFRGSVNANIIDFLNINNIGVVSTQAEVVYSSSVIQSLRSESVYDWLDFIKMFGLYVLSMIVPSRWMPDAAYLTKVALYHSPFGGGSLLSSYFNTWFGAGGVLICGYWISFLMKMVTRERTELWTVYLVMVFSTFPRWFSYSPIVMFKLCVYGGIAWYLFERLRKIVMFCRVSDFRNLKIAGTDEAK